MNLYRHFETKLTEIAADLVNAGALPDSVRQQRLSFEPARDVDHGDISTNVAMMLAKAAQKKPREIAELFTGPLAKIEGVTKVEIAGPGFINLTLDPKLWARTISTILGDGEKFGRSGAGANKKVNVEYVSVNPTGPLHVGHGRNAAFGDALANLLDFAGYDVTREYYINDAGGQVDTLARSAFLRYREALGEDIGTIPEGLYPGDYLKPVGEALAKAHGAALRNKPETEWLPIVREAAIASMMDLIRKDLAALGVVQKVFFSERTLTSGKTDQVAETIEELRAKGLVFQGRLPPPKGEVPEDWEDREQTLFKATAFGDDLDRVLIKSNGAYTYFAGDMAYHRDKFRRGFTTMIDVWGADHAGHIRKMKSAVTAISDGKATLDVKVCQLVKLFRGGEPVKMSKRSGNFVTLQEAVDEVGRDPVRFMMLYRKNDAALDFDFAKVTEQSKDNPVFYVQYAHARAGSIFRNAHEIYPQLTSLSKVVKDADTTKLNDAGEQRLLKQLALFPRLAEGAALAHEPHRIAFYLYELASEFHAQWNRGKDQPHLRFIRDDDRDLTAARLALVEGTRRVLASGLAILGVEAPMEMR